MNNFFFFFFFSSRQVKILFIRFDISFSVCLSIRISIPLNPPLFLHFSPPPPLNQLPLTTFLLFPFNSFSLSLHPHFLSLTLVFLPGFLSSTPSRPSRPILLVYLTIINSSTICKLHLDSLLNFFPSSISSSTSNSTIPPLPSYLSLPPLPGPLIPLFHLPSILPSTPFTHTSFSYILHPPPTPLSTLPLLHLLTSLAYFTFLPSSFPSHPFCPSLPSTPSPRCQFLLARPPGLAGGAVSPP